MAAGASKPKTDRQYKSLKLQADVLRDLDNGVSREIILKTYGFKNQSNITAIKKRREKILSQISGGLDVIQAMKWSLSAWQSVTKNTIVNCFRKAGFEKNDHFDSDTDVEDVQTDVLQTSTLFPAGVSFDEFATVDDDLVITDDVSDVIHSSDSESDEEIGERDVNPKPSKHDALNALRVLVRYNDFESFVRQDVVDKMERALLKHAIETMKETRITDYFQRQDKSMQ